MCTPSNYIYDVFIAYAGVDPDKDRAEELYRALLDRGRRVFLAPHGLAGGSIWPRELLDALRRSRMTVVLVSPNTGEAFYTQEEVARAIALHQRGAHRLVRVDIEHINEDDVPFGLAIVQAISWQGMGGANGVADELLKILGEELDPGIPGVAPREQVSGGEGLHGQVFAVELLTQAINLYRQEDGRIQVYVDRRHVQDAVYTTRGKAYLCQKFLTEENMTWAKQQEREIFAFMLGSQQGKRTLDLKRFPLRWASGGVLSVIHIPGSDEPWTPFFFRDIQPVGWNIALGASESDDELDNPWRFLLREFLEETLVFTSGPPWETGPPELKTFAVGEPPDPFHVERQKARHFAEEHIALRNRDDKLSIPGLQEYLDSDAHQCGRTIEGYSSPTNTDVWILDNKGRRKHPWKDMLVCFNLTELGIEVIKVLHYTLDQADYILDGEILKRGKSMDEWELVRMPVALISHRFLRRVFNEPENALRYVYPEVYEEGAEHKTPVKQPSVDPGELPSDGEMKMFHYDADRRRELSESSRDDTNDSNVGCPRHACWAKNFESYFYANDGTRICSRPYPYFTPASAKALACYFANQGAVST